MDVEILRKISVKTVGAQDAARNTRKTGQSERLMRVYGIANGVKQGETDYGQFTALIGQFEAQSLIDQKVYQSHKLFLPGGLDEIVSAALLGQQDSKGVQFAFEISAVPDESSQIGYKYVAQNLVQPAKNDVLGSLRASLGVPIQEQKQLAATASETTVEQAPQTRAPEPERHATGKGPQHPPPAAKREEHRARR